MANDRITSLNMLPIELVYRIVDHLNHFEMVFAVRNICTRLNELVNTYHRYQVSIILASSSSTVVRSLGSNLSSDSQATTTFKGRWDQIGDEDMPILSAAFITDTVSLTLFSVFFCLHLFLVT